MNSVLKMMIVAHQSIEKLRRDSARVHHSKHNFHHFKLKIFIILMRNPIMFLILIVFIIFNVECRT